MRFLELHIGTERFVLDTNQVQTVLPLLFWKQVLNAPVGVVGMFNCHGTILPLIDLAMLVLDRPTVPRMHSRILLINAPDEDKSSTKSECAAFGLIAERVAGVFDYNPADFVIPDPLVDASPYLGQVRADAHGIIQRLDLKHLMHRLTSWQPLRSEAA